jgi:hypothetical protein
VVYFPNVNFPLFHRDLFLKILPRELRIHFVLAKEESSHAVEGPPLVERPELEVMPIARFARDGTELREIVRAIFTVSVIGTNLRPDSEFNSFEEEVPGLLQLYYTKRLLLKPTSSFR